MKLVKNDLLSIDYDIYQYLKEQKDSFSNREKLSAVFQISINKVRDSIQRLKKSPLITLNIQSHNLGYRIAPKGVDANKTLTKKVISGIINILSNGGDTDIFYKVLNSYKEQVKNAPTHNQQQIQFNGWEKEVKKWLD